MSDEAIKVEVEQPVTAVEAEAREIEAEASVEAVEASAEAAVEIAEIEANRDIALAEINAEARVEEAAAIGEAIAESEEREIWPNIEALQTAQLQMAEMLGEMQGTLQSIQQQLTPPPSSQANLPSESADGLPAEEAPVEAKEPPAKPKRSRWI